MCMQGGPAALSRRILPGDVLLDIDGISIAGVGIGEVQRRLKGRHGSFVTLTLARNSSVPGQAPLSAPLQVTTAIVCIAHCTTRSAVIEENTDSVSFIQITVTLLRKKLDTLSRSIII